MPKNSLRSGVAGANNALHQPYRLVGGSHEKPLYFSPVMNMTRTVRPSDFHETATYANGVQGGILAKLALGQELDDYEKNIIQNANEKPKVKEE